jgi:hypothetical protein
VNGKAVKDRYCPATVSVEARANQPLGIPWEGGSGHRNTSQETGQMLILGIFGFAGRAEGVPDGSICHSGNELNVYPA